MKNGIGQYQRVLLIGGTSEIGNEIVRNLPLVPNPQIYRIGISESSDFALDLTSPIEDGLEAFIKETPDIDVAIFASGVLGQSPELSRRDEIERLTAINFANQIILISCVARKLVLQGHGQIVVLSSVAGIRPRAENFVYGATKSGLDFFARGLREHIRDSGVQVLVVRPGFVFSRMTEGMNPAPFATTVAHVAKVVVKALGKNRKIIYVPGILKLIFLILRVLPEGLFRKISSR
jgi:decaprenylphospho-beta-D-erythro-pentofuranosid-2-ulose 2-reductase